MKFGLYSELQLHPGQTAQEVINNTLKQIVHADQTGFDVYSIIDHHHFPRFSCSANPLALYSAASQLTRNIRFRTALHILPQQNPLRLAGEIAVADILTNGRMEVGVGRGHAWVYPDRGIVPIEEARERFEEALAILEQGLYEGRVHFSGKYYQADNVEIVPRPLQQRIQMATGGTSDHTYEQAGAKGWSIFVPPLLPLDNLKRQFDIYRESCAKHGNKPSIIFLHAVYMDDNPDNIRKESEIHFKKFLEGNASPALSGGLPKHERMKAGGFHFYTMGILERLADMTYKEITEGDVVWAGTPEQICEKVDRVIREVEGLSEIDFLVNYGGMDHWKAIKLQEMLSKEVMPHFRKNRQQETVV